jgi:hypothetical protein
MEPKIIENKNNFVWNFLEIKIKLQDYIAKYTNLVVNEENLKSMESDQKEIAGVRIKIDNFRKEVKKKLEEPYKRFETEIKELQLLVEQVEKPLKDQILKYENARIVKLESELLTFAEKSANSLGVRPEYFGKFAIKSDWTKKTAKLPATKKAVITVIEDMLSQQSRDDEAVKLKRERIEMIAGLCAVHSQSAGLKTPVIPDDVNHLVAMAPLPEISNIIIQVCHDRRDMEQRAAIPDPPPAAPEPVIIEPTYIPSGPPRFVPPNPVSQSGPPMPPVHPQFIPNAIPPMPPVMPATWNVVLRLPEITIPQASGFKAFLDDRGIRFEIVSQEKRNV